MRRPALFLSVTLLLLGATLAGCLQQEEPAPDQVPPEVEEEVQVAAEVAPLLEAVRTAVAEGGTVTVAADPVYLLGNDPRDVAQEFELELVPSTIVNASTWARVGDQIVAMPFFEVYEGTVAGQPEHLARLTISSEWARGTIRVDDHAYLIRVNMDGNMPLSSGSDANATARTFDTNLPERYDAPWWSEASCDFSLTGTVDALLPKDSITPMVEPGMSAAAALPASIIMDGDLQFHEQLGSHAIPMLAAMLAEVDEIYQYEMGIRLHAAGFHLHDEETIPDPMEDDPLEALSDYWNADGRLDIDRDVVHLVSGQEASYGVANCIGGAGHKEVAYTFSPLNWEDTYEVFHRTAIAHELGHIFSAHHHYGNHAEAGAEAATIMIQGYTPGDNPAFSTLSKSYIRGWAEQHLDA